MTSATAIRIRNVGSVASPPSRIPCAKSMITIIGSIFITATKALVRVARKIPAAPASVN